MWLRFPSSAYFLELPDLTSESESLSRALAASAMSRSTSKPPKFWARELKKDRSTMLRSILTCDPSRANSIVAEWLESWPVSPARIIRSQESALESSASTDSYGTIRRRSFATWDQTGCFWRTSQASMFPMEEMSGPYFPRDSGLYLETWPRSGSMRSGSVYERPTWEPATAAPDGSVWPTARAEDSESCGNHPGATDSLTGATRNWGSPRVTTNGGNPSPQCTGNGSRLEDQAGEFSELDRWLTPHGMNGQDHTGKQGRGGEFAAQATNWTTPQAHDVSTGSPDRVHRHGTKHGCANLTDDVTLWMAPNCPNGGRSVSAEVVASKGSTEDGKRQVGLESQTKHWPTPNTPSGGPNTKSTATHTGGMDLDGSVLMWGTPTSRDYKDGSSAGTAPTNGLLGRQVIQNWPTPIAEYDNRSPEAVKAARETVAKRHAEGRYGKGCGVPSIAKDLQAMAMLNSLSSLPAPAIPDGPPSSPTSPGSLLPSQRKKLNPSFAEWLMGLPLGWTSKDARIDSARLAMAFARYRRQLHLLCSQERRD